MKKQLVSLAVAAALASPLAAQAGTQIYGKLHVSIDKRQDDSAATDGWDVVSRASRLGFKGSEDLGNGLKAIWKLEFQIAMADADGVITGESGNSLVKARNMYVGLAGGWGTFLYGRHDTPFKISTGRLDKFADTLADYNGPIGPGFQDIRADNAIAYITPSFGGLTIAAAIVPAGNRTAGGAVNPDSDGLADTYLKGGVDMAGNTDDKLSNFLVDTIKPQISFSLSPEWATSVPPYEYTNEALSYLQSKGMYPNHKIFPVCQNNNNNIIGSWL